jgi:hypothetical protein
MQPGRKVNHLLRVSGKILLPVGLCGDIFVEKQGKDKHYFRLHFQRLNTFLQINMNK